MPLPDQHPAAALLLLADGRFPAGGYAHSGGLEPAVTAGRVRTAADLERFVAGRLQTTGLVAAAVAAAGCRLCREQAERSQRRSALEQLDAELDARTPSPVQRSISRRLGQQFIRALAEISPDTDVAELGPEPPHQPIALGVAYATLGLGPGEVALAALHETAAAPVAAAVRLLRVDPYATYAVLIRLAPVIDQLARDAVEASTDLADLPAATAPLLDSDAERHRKTQTRLFAS